MWENNVYLDVAAWIVLELWWCGNEGTPEPREWGGWRERVEGGIECFSWAERRLYLADNSYSRKCYCATANTRDGGNKQWLQKRQTNDSTLHSKLFSSYKACICRVTLKVEQSCAVYVHLLHHQRELFYKSKIRSWINSWKPHKHNAIPCELLYWSYWFICYICPNEPHWSIWT